MWTSLQLYLLYTDKRSEHVLLLQTITIRDALNSALDEEMARDGDVFILGEEVSGTFVISASSCAVGACLCCPRLTAAFSMCRSGNTKALTRCVAL